jgi:hypothetical protein
MSSSTLTHKSELADISEFALTPDMSKFALSSDVSEFATKFALTKFALTKFALTKFALMLDMSEFALNPK